MLIARATRLALTAVAVAACSAGDDGTAPTPGALARVIQDESDLIGGPLAVGRVGDYLLANEKIRLVIRSPGRAFSNMLTYGGNIVDADIVRAPGEAGQDNFGAMTPEINLSSTVHVTSVEVVSDGSNGEPAVIRTQGVDDLFDFIDLTRAIRAVAGLPLSLPPSAVNRDLPVSMTTEFSLAAGSTAVRIETTIHNEGAEIERLYVGDYINGGGELDTFVPSLGFGEPSLRPTMDLLAYAGIGQARGVSYGVVPERIPERALVAAGFSTGGFTVCSHGQSITDVLLNKEPGALEIAPGTSASFVRHFVVGDGDVADVVAARSSLLAEAVGKIRGRVTSGGLPVEGATVVVARQPGELGAAWDVRNAARSDAAGFYEIDMPPGEYLVLAKREGQPFEASSKNASLPRVYPVDVTASDVAMQDLVLPPTGALRVVVTDVEGAPMPAKITLVGLPGGAYPTNTQQFMGAFALEGFLFGSPVKQRGKVAYGIAGVHFAGADGDTGEVLVPPGRYQLVVSRGPEFDAHKRWMEIVADKTEEVNVTLGRVLNTTGFVSADFHVHAIDSMDTFVPRAERVVSMAAEGVEYFVATDHDRVTDMSPEVARAKAQALVRAGIGDEVTAYNTGHINVFPLKVDPRSVTGGALDWGRAGVPPGSDYPSHGSYDLSPAEIFALAPKDAVVQINHINDPALGMFSLTGIDTAMVPPQSNVHPGDIRQDPSIRNFYDDGYTALELWIEDNDVQTKTFLESNLGDWFNLLNQGIIRTGTANSDTHDLVGIQAGGPRNFVASPVDVPEAIDDAVIAHSVNEGRSIGSNGPFVRVTVQGDDEKKAGLALGLPLMVPATNGFGQLRIEVTSPRWCEFDRIEVYTNTVPSAADETADVGVKVARYAAAPSRVLRAGRNFSLRSVTPDKRVPTAARWEAIVDVKIPVVEDTWVVVLVRGTRGVSRPLWPLNVQDTSAEQNPTLEALTDGNLGEPGALALAFTNPIFLDANGNGKFDPPMRMPK